MLLGTGGQYWDSQVRPHRVLPLCLQILLDLHPLDQMSEETDLNGRTLFWSMVLDSESVATDSFVLGAWQARQDIAIAQ